MKNFAKIPRLKRISQFSSRQNQRLRHHASTNRSCGCSRMGLRCRTSITTLTTWHPKPLALSKGQRSLLTGSERTKISKSPWRPTQLVSGRCSRKIKIRALGTLVLVRAFPLDFLRTSLTPSLRPVRTANEPNLLYKYCRQDGASKRSHITW